MAVDTLEGACRERRSLCLPAGTMHTQGCSLFTLLDDMQDKMNDVLDLGVPVSIRMCWQICRQETE